MIPTHVASSTWFQRSWTNERDLLDQTSIVRQISAASLLSGVANRPPSRLWNAVASADPATAREGYAWLAENPGVLGSRQGARSLKGGWQWAMDERPTGDVVRCDVEPRGQRPPRPTPEVDSAVPASVPTMQASDASRRVAERRSGSGGLPC